MGSLTPETIEGLRGSVAKDKEAARLLDCAAGYVDRGWTQCSDAVNGRGDKVPGYSKRARCWCMLGAIRTANIRIGLVTLYQNAAGDLYPRELTPFASSVFERATWAAARAILGRDPKPHAHTVTIITQWNDTTAVCGETVAQRLRDGAAIIRLRIEKVQRSIRAKSNMTPREWERLRDFREHRRDW